MRFYFKSSLPSPDPNTEGVVRKDIQSLIREYGIKDKIDRVSVLIEGRNNLIKTKICFHGVYNLKIDAKARTSIYSVNNALDKVEKRLRKLVKAHYLNFGATESSLLPSKTNMSYYFDHEFG